MRAPQALTHTARHRPGATGRAPQGNTGRKIGELRGHTSSVTAIALDDRLNQVVSAPRTRAGGCSSAAAAALGRTQTCEPVSERSPHWASASPCPPAPVVVPRRLPRARPPQFTMSVDKTLKVWDLRTHRCLQTITEVRLGTPERVRVVAQVARPPGAVANRG